MFNFISNWFTRLTLDRSEKYTPIGRKILKIRRGKDANRFKKSITSVAYCIGQRGAVPDRIVEGEIGLFPYFEIAVNPQRRYSEDISNREIKSKAKESIRKSEDSEIIKCINAAARTPQTMNVSGGHLQEATINSALALIESHNVKPHKILVHPKQYADIRRFSDFEKGLFPRLNYWLFGHSGKLWGMKIYVSHRVVEGDSYILPKSKFLGLLAIRQDIKCKRSDNVKNLRDGWVLFEDIGICIVNDYALSKIHIFTENEEKIKNKRLEFFNKIENCSKKEICTLIISNDKQLINFITKYQEYPFNSLTSTGKSFATDIQIACKRLHRNDKIPAFIIMSENSFDCLAGEILNGQFRYIYKVPEFSYYDYKNIEVPEQELNVIISEHLDDNTLIVLSDEFNGEERSFERIDNVKLEKHDSKENI